MASLTIVKIQEIAQITPSCSSPKSANKFSFPLTFFDIFWYRFPPVDNVLFYQLNESASTPSYFYSVILPRLKQSLSLALVHYLPLAGKLKWPSDSPKPVILYTPNDGVSLTVAQSEVRNFDTLSGDDIYRANELHALVPKLMISEDTAEMISLQITLFPEQGFSIGFRLHHTAVDGKGVFMFIKSWGHLYKQLGGNYREELNSLPPNLIPFLDRSIVKDPTRLDLLYLKRWIDAFGENQAPNSKRNLKTLNNIVTISDDLVRAIFEFNPEDINKLKDKALSSAGKQLHLSTFVLTLAYTVTCLVKARGGESNRVVFIGFAVDCRTRLEPPLPITYFGNCLISARSFAKATSFMGENGFAFAVNMISDLVNNKLKNGVLEEAENELLNASYLVKPHQLVQAIQKITVSGSPRMEMYGSDFGLGRLKKVDVVSIDKTGDISMAESRHGNGGVEIGLALKKHEMRNFIACLISDGFCSSTPSVARFTSCKL